MEAPPSPCHPEEPTAARVRRATTLLPTPATNIGCPIQALFLGLSGTRGTQPRPGLPLVIRSEAEGPAVPLNPKPMLSSTTLSATSELLVEAPPYPCHPEEPTAARVRRATTLLPTPATNIGCPIQALFLGLSGTRGTQPRPGLPLVIRSEAEGPAVPLNPKPMLSSTTLSATSELLVEAPPYPCHPEEPTAARVRRATTLLPTPATNIGCPIQALFLGLSGTRGTQPRPGLPLVIRSEAEGPAVPLNPKPMLSSTTLSATSELLVEAPPYPCHPEEPTAARVRRATTLLPTPATNIGCPIQALFLGLSGTRGTQPRPGLPLVIRSEAEGPAVPLNPKPMLSSTTLSATSELLMEAPPYPCHPEEPTAARVRRATTLLPTPATNIGCPIQALFLGLSGTRGTQPRPGLPLVIRSEAEGPAVPLNPKPMLSSTTLSAIS